MSYFKTHCTPLPFRNINNVTMPSEIFETKLFDEKEQSAVKFPDTESNFQTLLSSAKANNINTNLFQDFLSFLHERTNHETAIHN